MKVRFALALTCLGLLFAGTTYACGDSCYSNNSVRCGSSDDACGSEASYSYSSCDQPSDCACADTGYRFNDCMSKCEYCAAFGNVGAR